MFFSGKGKEKRGGDFRQSSIKGPLAVGVDIGSHAVKICHLQVGRGGVELLALGTARLPPGVVEEGVIQEPETVARVVSGLMRHLKIRERRVAVAVSGHSVIVKKINLAAQSDAEMEKFIQAEADQYIPFDIDEVYLDFQVLATPTAETGGRADVILAAAKRELVDRYTTMLTAADLKAVVVDVDIFALQNILEANAPLPAQFAIVDIGASKMNINLVQHGASALARDIQFGSGHLTERIQSRLRISPEEAESIKLGATPAGTHAERLREIYEEIAQQWTGEIRKALEMFAKTQTDGKIEKIIITGGAARINGMVDWLTAATGLPTEMLNPFRALKAKAGVIDPRYLAAVAPEMSIAAGLATRAATF